ncbi:MAG: ABC transporter permease YtrF precursor [Planctomycetes bacterium ADurb.Bin126]|nr:MAG: ABC transporter permease YtrF precursor [Planctomycetes bacterium ADurb.Bin126]HOD83755.1 ABC transporter permease [Phycisphaerae bacterium]
MAFLPLANVLHHKLRSVLSSLGIGIGICMLITLAGLTRGSLYEIADRWESVGADLILFARGWGEDATIRSGAGVSDKLARIMTERHKDIVDQAVPVFTWSMKLAGQDHMAAGVDPRQWQILTGGRTLSEGRLFDPDNRFAAWLEKRLLGGGGDENEVVDIRPAELSDPAHDGLELVIDSRLAKVGKFRVGQKVQTANHTWTITGIVPAGVMTRIFLPRRTAQFLFSGDIQKSTMIFIKLRAGVDVGPACERLSEATAQDVFPLDRYRSMLTSRWRVMFVYVDMVNAVALVIAFLFIMVTLYTMVLQRTREVAILKSCGASNAFIIWQVLAESLLLTGAGAAMGVALSFLAAWLIATLKPLLTVTITWQWIAAAVVVAAVGAAVAAVYPAWRATRVDMASVLTLE